MRRRSAKSGQTADRRPRRDEQRQKDHRHHAGKTWLIGCFEATLRGLAALGGSTDARLAKRRLCHRTQRKRSRYGAPTLFVPQGVAIVPFFE
ncbi:MAG: hypothetical protein IJ785_08660 [Bacteroidales bacterium]|nr:hypothetical protein [Bacteroidales bacterium]